MKLEQQVCSLELAKKLKELGVKQESLFWYERVKVAGKNEWLKDWTLAFNNNSKPYSEAYILSAFTVAELGQILPDKILYELYHDHLWQINAYGQKIIVDTEADARAKMLIYLLENKLIYKRKIEGLRVEKKYET